MVCDFAAKEHSRIRQPLVVRLTTLLGDSAISLADKRTSQGKARNSLATAHPDYNG